MPVSVASLRIRPQLTRSCTLKQQAIQETTIYTKTQSLGGTLTLTLTLTLLL